MDSKLIAQQIIDIGAEDLKEALAFKNNFIELSSRLLVKNAEPILLIENEAQMLDVINEIITIEFSNEKIRAIINKSIPVIYRPFEGILISLARSFLTGSLIKFLDEKVLDKYIGENWFEKLKDLAKKAKNG